MELIGHIVAAATTLVFALPIIAHELYRSSSSHADHSVDPAHPGWVTRDCFFIVL